MNLCYELQESEPKQKESVPEPEPFEYVLQEPEPKMKT